MNVRMSICRYKFTSMCISWVVLSILSNSGLVHTKLSARMVSMLGLIGNVCSASKRSLRVRSVFFCFALLNQKSIGLFSLAHSPKPIIAARQHSTEICNACRYWSVFVGYCMDIIWLIHFMIEMCVFYCGACHCFTVILMSFTVCVLTYTGVWYFMNVFFALHYCVRKWHNKTVQSISSNRGQTTNDNLFGRYNPIISIEFPTQQITLTLALPTAIISVITISALL